MSGLGEPMFVGLMQASFSKSVDLHSAATLVHNLRSISPALPSRRAPSFRTEEANTIHNNLRHHPEMPELLAAKYAAHMKSLGLGYGLIFPPPFEHLQPGICGYLDGEKRWQKILDLRDDEKLEELGYSKITDLGSLVHHKANWRPLVSASVDATPVEFGGGISAASLALPTEAKSAMKYNAMTDFGAVLMCDKPVITEYYEHEDGLRSWLQQNAATLMKEFPDIERYGFYAITRTFSSEDINIATLDNKKGELLIGVGADVSSAGNTDASIKFYRGKTAVDWRKFDGKKRVIFFSGIHMKFERQIFSRELRLKEIPESEWQGPEGSFRGGNMFTGISESGNVSEQYEASLEDVSIPSMRKQTEHSMVQDQPDPEISMDDLSPPLATRGNDGEREQPSSDTEELGNILSYCDAESTTDSGSDGHFELAGLSSFAANHNNRLGFSSRPSSEASDFNDLPTSVENNPHLQRLLWPQMEHEVLLEMRKAVFDNSLTFRGHEPLSLDHSFEANNFLITSAEGHLFATSDQEVSKMGQQLKSFVTSPLVSQGMSPMSLPNIVSLRGDPFGSFNDLYQARNVALGAYANMLRMKRTGFCENSIVIILAERARTEVAALLSIPISSIESLCYAFEFAIQAFNWLSDLEILDQNSELEMDNFLEIEHLGDVLANLTSNCRAFLRNFFDLETKNSGETERDVWLLAAKTLDAAVAFYSCANIEQPNYGSLRLPRPPKPITLRIKPPEVFGVRLETLRCLNVFLQARRVWVFRTWNLGQELIGQGELYLTASIKDLGDIWGPVWGRGLDEQHGASPCYEIGGGSIVPWKHDPSIHPALKANERLCHWQKTEDLLNVQLVLQESQDRPQSPDRYKAADSSRQSSDLLLEGGQDIHAAPFYDKDMLLIGATPPRLRFEVCRCSKSLIISELRDSACLYPLRTRRGYHYIDSTAKGFSGGQYFNINASKTKKWEKMTPWKQTILDEWEKDPSLRGTAILILERLIGIVVSVCTFNATRVRLVELLKTDSMRYLLSELKWKTRDGRRLFFEALDNPDYRAIRRLRRDREDLRDDIEDAISACLKALSSTGYDEAHDQLNLLWIPALQSPCDDIPERALPQRVVLKGPKHQWVRLLRDTEISCTMAVVVEDSLANRGHGGRSCRRRGPDRPTVLETAIRINSQVDPSQLLREVEQPIPVPAAIRDPWYQEEVPWQKYYPRLLKQGSTFRLGYQGQLKVLGLIFETGLLLTWEKKWLERIRELLELEPDGPGSICHNEFTGEMWGAITRPLPVHVMARD